MRVFHFLQLQSPGKYRVVYLNTNSRALPPAEAFQQYEGIARNIKEACRIAVGAIAAVDVLAVATVSAIQYSQLWSGHRHSPEKNYPQRL